MQFISSVQIAQQLINYLFIQFDLALRTKQLAKIAEPVTAKAFTNVANQFVRLIGSNECQSNIINQQQQPQRIKADCHSTFKVGISEKRRISLDTILTTEKPNKNRSSSIMKQTFNNTIDNQKTKVVKLTDIPVPEKIKPTEQRMRKLYLIKLQQQKKYKQEQQMKRIQSQNIKLKQAQFMKNRANFTYDFNGKIIQVKGASNTASLSTSLKSKMNKKVVVCKKADKRKSLVQNIDVSCLLSTYKKHRRLSTQSIQQKINPEPIYHQIPQFQNPQKIRIDQMDTSMMKLLQFKRFCKKSKARPYKFFLSQTKQTINLPSINNSNISIPSSIDYQKRRFLTQNTIEQYPYRSKKNKRASFFGRIKVNIDLYDTIMGQQ